jgi:hypothetical protein
MPHCPNSTFHSSISLLRMSVLPATSCKNRETLNKTSTAPRSPESIQVTLPHPPLPLLETALRTQVLQRHQPLQAHLLHSRARPPMTIAKFLSSHSSQGSGACCVQTVALSSFNHISSKYIDIFMFFSFSLMPANVPSRHAKTHSKPYACRVQPNCASRFAEQRDRKRHEARHGLQSQSTVQFFCPHDCERSLTGAEGGFGVREDNAKRHIRSRHNGSTVPPIRIIT